MPSPHFYSKSFVMTATIQTATETGRDKRLRNHDKLNCTDFHWFLVRTLPHQERKLAGMLRQHQSLTKNILEVYCPTHTTVSVVRNGKDEQAPLFAGHVFVLATQQALTDFIDRYYPEGIVLYDRKREDGKKARLWTIPEDQMRMFKDFNENYADKVIILERPYTDYAFNSTTNEPNEIIRVVDGPLAGREGYLARFRRDKRLVFNMKTLDSDRYFAVSIPNVWSLRVVRLHNAEGDRQSAGTAKERAADLLLGLLQACGFADRTLPAFHSIMETLAAKPSLTGLRQTLDKQDRTALSQRLAALDTADAELLLNLARYEHDNPGYVKATWRKLVLRPYLTPTPGIAMEENQCEAVLRHEGFTEVIRKVSVAEETYYPSKEKAETVATTYYAHIGILPAGPSSACTLFANWDAFLEEYFMTGGKANERLVGGTACPDSAHPQKDNLTASFRNYAPTLYKVLTDESSWVKAVPRFCVGNETLNVLSITATADIAAAKDELINTCTAICREINATPHLALWRRYLRSVWLHV